MSEWINKDSFKSQTGSGNTTVRLRANRISAERLVESLFLTHSQQVEIYRRTILSAIERRRFVALNTVISEEKKYP